MCGGWEILLYTKSSPKSICKWVTCESCSNADCDLAGLASTCKQLIGIADLCTALWG